MIDEQQLDDHHRIIHHGSVWYLQSRMSDGKTFTDWQTHGQYIRREGAIAAYKRRVAKEDPSRRDEEAGGVLIRFPIRSLYYAEVIIPKFGLPNDVTRRMCDRLQETKGHGF